MHRVWVFHEQRQKVQRLLQDGKVSPQRPDPSELHAGQGLA